MTESRARRRFKALAGQSNHHLITILVGLDQVRSGRARKGGSFSTSWNPADVKTSADRSADFARSALLAWLVDALDPYLRALGRLPPLGTAQMRKDLGEGSNSVARRLRVSCATISGSSASSETSLTEMAIQWRKRLVHTEATNELEADTREVVPTARPIYPPGVPGT